MSDSGKQVKLTLSNELRLTGVPEPLRQELVETLTLMNPKWLENERMGRWNRNVSKTLRFYRKTGKGGIVIPRGYIRRLIYRLRKDDLNYAVVDKRRELPSVELAFSGMLKPFQFTAVNEMLKKEFGTLCAPTGSGKTVMALHMIAARRQPAVIVVHTRDLAYQWMQRVVDFLHIPEKEIGLIGAGKKRVGDRITVAMVQSLYKCAAEVSPGCGYIVVDECHRTPSRTFTEAITAFDARYMLGLSATPWRRDKLSKLIFWHLGDVYHEVEKAGLVEDGHVLEADIIVRETDFVPFHDPFREYSKMLSELTVDDKRNRLIVSDVAQEVKTTDGVCLVLTDRKLHGETLNSLLRYKHQVASGLMTGDLTVKERREVLEQLNRGELRVLVATGQLIGEGFDWPNLTTLFLATPIRFSGRVTQYLGRVMRPAPGKKRARVYDYVDIQVDVLVAAAKARQRVYDSGKEPATGK